jgi:MSHA pilin protein MshA
MFTRKGFTLIELIMVIVIIGILAAVAVPKFVNLRKDAQKAQCMGSAAAIKTAISNYYAKAAISATATQSANYPVNILPANTAFGKYLSEGTMPVHPIGRTWNSYYTAATGLVTTGQGAATGACTW